MSSETKVPVKPSSLPAEKVVIDAQDAIPTHPLDSLTPDEMKAMSYTLRHYIAEHRKEIKAVKFICCNIIAPPKRDVLAYLGIPTEPGKLAEKLTNVLLRRAETDFADPVTGNNYNASLTWNQQKSVWTVDVIEKLPDGVQPQITVEELIECDELMRKDERIVKLAADVGLKPEQLYADGWSSGWDSRWPTSQRIMQCLLFARLSPDDNLYAHPLDFVPVIDVNKRKVIHLDFPPHRIGGNLSATTVWPKLEDDALSASGRQRVPPPMKPDNYLPDLLAAEPNYVKPVVEPLKPLHIVQPEGVSFRMTGNVLEWQAWKMHVAFGQREGIVLSTITYNDNGQIRPVMYRLSLAEMVVPYAAPEHPHPRKHAFDVGEYGMGTQANELSLGCDCLGAIHYLPGSFISHDGSPVVLKRAICIHEEDAGVLWKHTDYRVGGRSHSVRSRRLVVSMVCTVANYEYALYFHFYLDGTIELETKLTGILNTYVLAEGESAAPYGVQVAPGINAQYHQHIFSLRVDPMVDGLNNTVVQSDILPSPYPSGSDENFAGNAFTTEDLRISSSKLAVQDWDASKDRRWRIVNPKKKHYASGKEAAYGIMGGTPWIRFLSREGSFPRRRAAFAEHSVWVVKDVEGPLGSERQWPAGKYVPQTQGNPPDSVINWVSNKDENLEGEDIVLFLTFGVTHIPRPEDWPVMPSEHVKVVFKPQNFFDRNPSLHVAAERDTKSVMAFGEAPQVNAVNGTSGVHTHDNSCCH